MKTYDLAQARLKLLLHRGGVRTGSELHEIEVGLIRGHGGQRVRPAQGGENVGRGGKGPDALRQALDAHRMAFDLGNRANAGNPELIRVAAVDDHAVGRCGEGLPHNDIPGLEALLIALLEPTTTTCAVLVVGFAPFGK